MIKVDEKLKNKIKEFFKDSNNVKLEDVNNNVDVNIFNYKISIDGVLNIKLVDLAFKTDIIIAFDGLDNVVGEVYFYSGSLLTNSELIKEINEFISIMEKEGIEDEE